MKLSKGAFEKLKDEIELEIEIGKVTGIKYEELMAQADRQIITSFKQVRDEQNLSNNQIAELTGMGWRNWYRKVKLFC